MFHSTKAVLASWNQGLSGFTWKNWDVKGHWAISSPKVLGGWTLNSAQAILLWKHQATILAELRWHMLQSDIPKHCKNCLWMPSDWCCKDFWKPIAQGPLLPPTQRLENRGASLWHTEVKMKGVFPATQEGRLMSWDFKCRTTSLFQEITCRVPINFKMGRAATPQSMFLNHHYWKLHFLGTAWENQLGYFWLRWSQTSKEETTTGHLISSYIKTIQKKENSHYASSSKYPTSEMIKCFRSNLLFKLVAVHTTLGVYKMA